MAVKYSKIQKCFIISRESASNILIRKRKRTATSSNAVSVQTLPAMLELSYKTRQLGNQISMHAAFQNKNG